MNIPITISPFVLEPLMQVPLTQMKAHNRQKKFFVKWAEIRTAKIAASSPDQIISKLRALSPDREIILTVVRRQGSKKEHVTNY